MIQRIVRQRLAYWLDEYAGHVKAARILAGSPIQTHAEHYAVKANSHIRFWWKLLRKEPRTVNNVPCATCGAPATYRLGTPTPAWCDNHGPHGTRDSTALAEAWDDGFSACAGEHLKQRSDPAHPITRTNPHDTTPGGLIA